MTAASKVVRIAKQRIAEKTVKCGGVKEGNGGFVKQERGR